MTHFIIKLVGVSIALGIRKAGDFRFSKDHNALIYQGREIPISEFNALVPKVMEQYKDYRPRLPHIVLLDRSGAEVATEPVEEPVSDPESPLVPMGVAQQGQDPVTDAAGDGEPPAPAAEDTEETPTEEPTEEPIDEPLVEEDPAPDPSEESDEEAPEPHPAPDPSEIPNSQSEIKKGGRPKTLTPEAIAKKAKGKK